MNKTLKHFKGALIAHLNSNEIKSLIKEDVYHETDS